MALTMTAFIALLIVAVVIGFAAQMIGKRHRNWEWLATAVGALVGGIVAGQYLGPLSTWGWQWEGLWVVPAIIGAVVVGAVVDAVVRRAAPAATPPRFVLRHRFSGAARRGGAPG